MNKENLLRSLKNQRFSESIIGAFEKVPREKFIPEKEANLAYHDIAVPIGHGQTISQPYTIAFMLTLAEIKDKQKILEVGSGSGYLLALLFFLNPNGKIFGVERIKELAENSKKNLKNYKNIRVIFGDGSKGLEGEKDFDRIIVSATCNEIPQKLLKQLKFGGILVAPVHNSIVIVKKMSGENKIKEYPGFVFVPLISDEDK